MAIGFQNDHIIIPETTTPTAEADHGKIYMKTDNEYYFQDGAGTEHRLAVSDFAGIFVDANAVATTILLVEAYEIVEIFDTDMPELVSNGTNGSSNITIGATAVYQCGFSAYASSAGNGKTYEFFIFEIAASGDSITAPGVTQATPAVVTSSGHSFSNGNRVKISGVSGMIELNDQIYTVTNAGPNDFELEDDDGTDIASGGYGAYTSGGTVFLATQLIQCHAERKFANATDIGAMTGIGFASLTANNTLELHVKNDSDATNVTIEGAQFWMKRV